MQKKISDDEIKKIQYLYWDENKSYKEISLLYNVSCTTIKNFMVRHDIPRRSTSEGTKIARNKPEVIEKRRKTVCGKPSGAIGKKWKLKYRRTMPNRCGAGNPQWKGGKTDLQRRIRTLPEYNIWRSAVFSRDNYTCMECGRKTCVGDKVVIQGDHVYPFSKILDDFKIKDMDAALKCEALWDIDNGRTLCKECHKKTPTWGCNLNKKKQA